MKMTKRARTIRKLSKLVNSGELTMSFMLVKDNRIIGEYSTIFSIPTTVMVDGVVHDVMARDVRVIYQLSGSRTLVN